MKYILFIAVFFLSTSLCYGQRRITTKDLKSIKRTINQQIPNVKKQLAQRRYFDKYEIGFALDTFRIEKMVDMRIDINYSTDGMNRTVQLAGEAYDSLRKVYYQKLLKILAPEDKKVIRTAHKAWLAFHNAEYHLIWTMAKPQYAGLGTINSNIAVSRYAYLEERRALTIFHYFHDAITTKNYFKHCKRCPFNPYKDQAEKKNR